MARTTPTVCDGYLEWQTDETIERIPVGTPAWFTWLDQHTTFAYVTPRGSVTVRRDRGQRGGWYWRAYLRREGRLQRYYLGISTTLTPARLQAAADALFDTLASNRNKQATAITGEPTPQMATTMSHKTDVLTHSYDRPFLAARLNPPPVGRQLLERPTLLSCVSEAVRARLTLLIAPAAFGKTTLLGQWCHEARRRGWPVAWLSLERGDNDPARFWHALLAAMQVAYPGFGRESALRLEQRPGESTEPIVVALLNDLATIPHDLTIVLDDYQLIGEEEIHTALVSFVGRLPPQIHLVVASRSQPPWPLGRLRAAYTLTEIRAAMLCLTIDEVALLLRECLQLSLSSAQIAELFTLTEGWIGGLQLAAHVLREQPRALGAAPLISGDHDHLAAFFVEEVLQGLPASTQTFLCESAILDRLNASLCTAVTGESASASLLETLSQNQLFLTALDSEQRWYSYHPLFSTFLRNRLAGVGLERRIALYQAAVRWFAQAGLLEEAIDHGLAGGLVDETVDLIERYGDGWLVRGELRTLRSWIDALPEALVRGRARLLLLQLCALMLDARWDCVEPLLIGLEARNDQTECVIVQALAALVGGQLVVAEAALDQARGRIHPDDRFLQTMLAMLDAAVCWVRGNETTAQALLATLPVPRLAGSGAQLALLAIAHQAHFDALAGRLEIAIVRYRQVCEQSRADDAGTNVGLGMALLGLAQIHYERNELVEALNAADLADEHAQRWGNQALQPPTALVRAQILIASGDLSATEDVVEHLERTVRGAPTLASALVCLALARAELALARDEAMIAASWLAGISRELAALPSGSLRERAQRLEVRALLERGETHAALASLQVLVEATQQRGRIASLVPLLALLACVYEALGQHQRASQLVLEAVQRGAVGPFVQSMISAGPLLHPLLAELPTGRREEIQYAGLVRVALAQQQLRRMHVHAIEPLSAREHEVLRLLADGATNREIAAQLLVTESTVKKHLSTIYQKFGVARRTQAILVAQARGLL